MKAFSPQIHTDEAQMSREQCPDFPGSTGGPPVGDGGLAIANFPGIGFLSEIVAAGRLRFPDDVQRTEEELT